LDPAATTTGIGSAESGGSELEAVEIVESVGRVDVLESRELAKIVQGSMDSTSS